MIGSVARVPDSVPLGRLTQDTVKLCFKRGDKEVERYIYWLLRAPEYRAYCAGRATGSAVVALSREDFLSYPVPNLSLARRSVVDLLEAIESKVRLLRLTNATLEAIARALFKSWFVDFDPVRAKMAGRAPEGMDKATAALFSDALEKSELGPVPKGWSVMPVGDAIDTVGGATPDTKNEVFWDPPLHRWTSPKDLSGASAPVLLDTERRISDLGLRRISSGLLPTGSLLMSSRAPIGYLTITQVPVAINQGYIGLLPGGKLSPLFMLFWCRDNMDAIKGRANGSTFMEISKKAFRPIPALVPTPELLKRFDEVVGALFGRLVENERQATNLTEIRDTLLPRLISGQLRLPEARAQLEAAA